jgi:hypothetical protein
VRRLLVGLAEGTFGSKAVSVGFGASSSSPDNGVRVSVVEIDDDTIDGFPGVLRVQVRNLVLE